MDVTKQIEEFNSLLRNGGRKKLCPRRRVYDSDKLLALIMESCIGRNHWSASTKDPGHIARSSRRLRELVNKEFFKTISLARWTDLEKLCTARLCSQMVLRSMVNDVREIRASEIFSSVQLELAKQTCPNLRLVHMRAEEVRVDATFDDSGRRLLNWTHQTSVQRDGRVAGTNWTLPQWPGWIVTSTVTLSFSATDSVIESHDQRSSYLKWYSDPVSRSPLFKHIHFEPPSTWFNSMRRILERMDDFRHRKGLLTHSTYLEHLSGIGSGFTLLDFQAFATRFGGPHSAIKHVDFRLDDDYPLRWSIDLSEMPLFLSLVADRFGRLEQLQTVRVVCIHEDSLRRLLASKVEHIPNASLSRLGIVLHFRDDIPVARVMFALARCVLFQSAPTSRVRCDFVEDDVPHLAFDQLVKALRSLLPAKQEYIRVTDFSRHQFDTLKDVYDLLVDAGIEIPSSITPLQQGRVGWRQLDKHEKHRLPSLLRLDAEAQAHIDFADRLLRQLGGPYGENNPAEGSQAEHDADLDFESEVRTDEGHSTGSGEVNDLSHSGVETLAPLHQTLTGDHTGEEAEDRLDKPGHSDHRHKRARSPSVLASVAKRPMLEPAPHSSTAGDDARLLERDEEIARLQTENKDLKSQVEALQSMVGKYEMEKWMSSREAQ